MYFKIICEEGSISKAARKLYMSQPPLTKQMHDLEKELNCSLFKRGSRQIELTNEGKLLYERSIDLLDLVEKVKREINNLSKEDAITLRIGLVSSINSYVLNNYLLPFFKNNSNIKYDISEANTYQLLERLNSKTIDFAFIRTPFKDDNSLVIKRIKKEELCLISLNKYDKMSLKRLKGVKILTYHRWIKVLEDYFKDNDIDINFSCVVDDARTCIDLVNNGIGDAIVPESVNVSDKIYKYYLNDLKINSEICLVYKKDINLNKASNLFIDSIEIGEKNE